MSLGAKYNLVDRPGFALAVEGRGFAGFAEDVAESRGLSAGPVVELGTDPLRLVAGVRWHELKHDTYPDAADGYVDWGDVRPAPGDDCGSIVQAHAMLAFGSAGRGHLLLGASCDFYVALEPRPERAGGRRRTRDCYPLAGISLPLGSPR